MQIRVIISCFVLLCFSGAYAQYVPGKYRVDFTDKFNNGYSLESPYEFLSERAIQRRIAQEIPFDPNDLPVSQVYIDSLEHAGIPVLNRSKWFNAVTTGDITAQQAGYMAGVSFIKDILFLKPSGVNKKSTGTIATQSSFAPEIFDYGYAFRQIDINNGQGLHYLGFSGSGMLIAVIDAGFDAADTLEIFDKIRNEGRLLGTWDFVNGGTNVFQYHPHGTSVLSIIGGFLPGLYAGTAPDASFILLRSEDASSEYLIEEDNWVSAAEFADSAGVDVINTSLGYTEFDDPAQNHTYADMDGNTTRISIAADIAASKGMLVVNSAGNEGGTFWKYISAPADGDSVLSIGAVDGFGAITSFSSRGPTSDGRLKPNVCGMGSGNFVVRTNGTISAGAGTSYSSPEIAGLSACLWQANPEATAMEIFRAIQQSADRYYDPDTIYGYGIPDFQKANLILRYNIRSKDMPVTRLEILPNPFSGIVYLVFESDHEGEGRLSVFNSLGQQVKNVGINVVHDLNLIHIDQLSDLPRGLYILHLEIENQQMYQKIIKF